MSQAAEGGPLSGIRVVEFAGIGPAPFAVMLLADLGAEVVRILRASAEWPDLPVVTRGRASITLDLKEAEHAATARDLVRSADVLVEGFRPGVMERLGLGPEALLQDNERLVYARMTGWGQDGPMATQAGHDINFIGLTGLLDMLVDEQEPPRAPLNLLGDYAGGALYMVIGITAALIERMRSGRGQVVDAAIVDGSASLLAPILGMIGAGVLSDRPADSILGGKALFYRTYRCRDGGFLAVGALERGFRRTLTDKLGIAPDALDDPANRAEIEALFATRSRDEWVDSFQGSDCCVSPVLDLAEAGTHPHLAQRRIYQDRNGQWHPGPAPRFSRSAPALPVEVDAATRLAAWGVRLPAALA